MQYHRIYARIDIDAILHNLGECKRRIPEGTKVLAVIKADGYGHGAVELAHQLEIISASPSLKRRSSFAAQV